MPWNHVSGSLHRAAVAAAAIGLTLLAAEAVLRMLPAGVVVEPDLYRMDDGLLLLRPGITRRHVTPLWDVTLRTDARGFRDVDSAPERADAVVLGLGDSQAFGWGVELDQTLYSQLEQVTRVRLIKAAVPGTGTSDQARLLERLLPVYRPTVVAVTFFVGNDFVDVGRGGSAQYEVIDGFLASRTQEPSSLRRLAIRSRVLQLVRAAQFRLAAAAGPERLWDERMREFAEVHLRDPPERAWQAMDATLAALDDIAEQCDRSGARLIVIVLPRSYQVNAGELEELLAGLGWRREDLELDRPQRLLGDWASSRHVAYVDTLPAFRAHAAGGGEPLFFSPDAHMTPVGHRVAAEQARAALDGLLR